MDGYVVAALLIALPFIVLAFILIPMTYKTTKQSLRALASNDGVNIKLPVILRVIALLSLILNFGGVLLLVSFWRRGGQSGYGRVDNPYLIMHLGVLFVVIGCVIGIVNGIMIRKLKH